MPINMRQVYLENKNFQMKSKCFMCGQEISNETMFPTKMKYAKCPKCIGQTGFKTVKEFLDAFERENFDNEE